MMYAFSNGLRDLSPSAVREIFKFTADPAVISLAAGNPAPETFPAARVAAISEQLLRDNPLDVLQYGITEGYEPLRRRVQRYMRDTHGVGGEEDTVLITAGAQQVMGLMAKTLCNPGDTVICEEPSFIGSLNSFRALGATLCGVPMEADGMDLTALETALKAHPNAKFLYTIPNFQNPTGAVMSLTKRRAVYALCRQYGVVILEDNPYGDLRFAGEPLPAIKSMDTEGLCVYAGSFSKVLAPGLRVGYAIGPKALLQKLTVAKQGEDVHTNLWAQMVCDRFMSEYYDAHLAELQTVYRRKATHMMALCDRYLVPEGIPYTPVEGGLFLWCRLPESVDMPRFCIEAAQKYKVAVVPGNAFSVNPAAPCHAIRLNFSTPTDDAMTVAVERLRACARAFQ